MVLPCRNENVFEVHILKSFISLSFAPCIRKSWYLINGSRGNSVLCLETDQHQHEHHTVLLSIWLNKYALLTVFVLVGLCYLLSRLAASRASVAVSATKKRWTATPHSCISFLLWYSWRFSHLLGLTLTSCTCKQIHLFSISGST